MNLHESVQGVTLLALAIGCGAGQRGTGGAGGTTGLDGGGNQPMDAAGPSDRSAEVEGPTRAYALASAGAQLLLDPQAGIYLTPANLATDVDVTLIHQEFYGLPWESFESGAEPPPEWVAVMDGLAVHAAAVGPVFLSLQLVSGPGRRFLADRAVIANGAVANPQSGWSAECYDFGAAPDGTAKRAAYVAYVDWMVRRFHPRFINVAIEMNMFMSCGDSAWTALVGVERAAYDAAKRADPTAIVFPSIQIDLLYGWGPDCTSPNRDTCFDAAYQRLANVARDRFAVTSFPFLFEPLRDPGVLADDWFTRAGDRGKERTVVAETGWLATPMVVALGSQCVSAIASNEATQLSYFERLMSAAERAPIDLITWVSNRDVVPTAMMDDCPCKFDARWCGFLDALRQSAGSAPDTQASAEYSIKQFGGMGLRNYDGTARGPLLAKWQSSRALRWSGAP